MDAEYTGYKILTLDDEAMTGAYLNIASPEANETYHCLTNEYLLFEDTDGQLKDAYRFDGERFVPAPYKVIRGRILDSLKPRNAQQRIALDMLFNPNITIDVIAGRFGSGKTLLMVNAAVKLLEEGKIDHIVYIRNNKEVKNSAPIGFLPGTSNEKMSPWAAPLADKVGGFDQLDRMIASEQIEVTPLGYVRGRDFKNSVILCSEAENLTKEHVQLLIGRVGENSQLWLDGDCKQTDADVFEKNSGMRVCVDKLKGHPRFGYVKLLKTERSETAAMADLLD